MGHDKSQAISFIKDRHPLPISFFGDKLHAGGNDFPVYSVLSTSAGDIAIAIDGWEETLAILKNI